MRGLCACGQFAGLTHVCAGTPVYYFDSTSDTTERATVLREREAAARARCAALWINRGAPHRPTCGEPCVECIGWAARHYPLRQRQTVRYEPDPHDERVRWCVCEGNVEPECLNIDGTWHESRAMFTPSRQRIALWSDLLARPFTLVDDDGTTP